MTTAEKLASLRAWMEKNSVNAAIIPNADPHNNEYQAPRWLSRQWLSGLKGSNGTVVVTAEKSGLWTDSRYYDAAEEALAGSEIKLFRASDPGVDSIIDWLKSELKAGDVVSFSGNDISEADASSWVSSLKVANISANTELDPVDEIWTDRPAEPCGKLDLVAEELTGQSTEEKLKDLRALMQKKGVQVYLLGRTDESNWLLNFRGTDMENHPTPYCYTLVSADEAIFFVDERKLSDEAKSKFTAAGFTIRGYGEVASVLEELDKDTRLLMVPRYTNHNLYKAGSHCFLIKERALATDLKGVKNEVEMENTRKVMIEDGAAMVRFYFWMYGELKAGRKVTELSASKKLLECRQAIPGFRHVSFDSIMGYKAHGALNHYSVDENSDVEVTLDGIFLIDSGGNFENGTSDTTRVIPMGTPTQEQKIDYTLVLKCLIELITAEFPEDATCAQLDGICRRPMWQHHRLYRHGTGHGVGYGLEVHEGPQNFSGLTTERMYEGMLSTIEPGIYRSGEYGIRIENMVHTVKSADTPFGKFFKFENLTFCPINVDLVDTAYMDDYHIEWLNDYNAQVVEKLSPLLNEDEVSWLKYECRPVGK